jgi:hypothetical protein
MGCGSAGRQPSPARQAWGEFLQEFRWQWFVTLTFRHQISTGTAWQICREFLCNTQNISRYPLGWFAVGGRVARCHRLHFHLLLAGARDLRSRELERNWYGRAGRAAVVEYDKSRGAAFYCANHLNQAGLDYYFSDNLPDFRSPTRPTSEQKIDGISPV